MQLQRVRKGAIFAGGYGTRFLPATKSVPKELFALLDTPAIEYIVDEMTAAGITQILIVTSRRKPALAAYFDRDIELEMAWAKGDPTKLAKIEPKPGVTFLYYPQLAMKGTGDAMLHLEDWSHGEPFVVAYPDDIVVTDADVPGLTAQLIAEYNRNGGRTVLAGQEYPGDVSRYGVVGYEAIDGIDVVNAMIEKPAPGTEPSNVVSYGRYLYGPDIFEALHRAQEVFTGNGEFTQTDALRMLLPDQRVTVCRFNGTVLDVGTPKGYLRATVEMALRRPDMRDAALELLADLGRREGIIT